MTPREIIGHWLNTEADPGAIDASGLVYADMIVARLKASGFVIVPENPTKEMIAVGNTAIEGEIDEEMDSPEGSYPIVRTTAAFETYRAMIAAALRAK